MSLYHLNVTVHLLAALLWLGGMFFLGVVGAPVLRKVQPAGLRAELFEKIGERFRTVGWIAIAVLLVTGAANLNFRGMLRWELLGNSGFWATPYGQALAWKLGTVAAMIVMSALHDFVLGPMASRESPESARALKLRRQVNWIARLNALVGLGLVVAAVRLARGG